MYDHTLHGGRNFFVAIVYKVFSEEILKCHIDEASKSIVNKGLKSLRKINLLNSIILKEK